MAIFFICLSGFLMGLCVWGVVSGLVNPFLAVIVVGGEFVLIYFNLKHPGNQFALKQHVKPVVRASKNRKKKVVD